MKIMTAVIAAAIPSLAICADTVYSEEPGDTSRLRVEGGATSMGGVDAMLNHMTHRWTFDDAEHPLADSIGSINLEARNGSTVTAVTGHGDTGGAVQTDNGLKISPNFITCAEPFSIAFWLKFGENSLPSHASQASFLYIGKQPKNKEETPSPRIMLGFGNNNMTLFLWETGSAHQSYSVPAVQAGDWMHFVLIFDGTKYQLSINGAISSNILTPASQITFDAEDNLLFGYGWHYLSGSKAIADGTFDEICYFDRALTADECRAVKNSTQPFEFTAGWSTLPTGTLDLYGRLAQEIYGVGSVHVWNSLIQTQAADTEEYFGGALSGGSLVVNNASSATTTLYGENTYTGSTAVNSGTLKIDPLLRGIPAFENELVGYWPLDNAGDIGADYSGNGNHLAYVSNEIPVTVINSDTVAGGAIRCPGNSAALYHSGKLNGFSSTVDNSFIIGGWVKVESRTLKEGFMRIHNSGTSATDTCIRFNSISHEGIYFGDNGSLTTKAPSFKWTTAGWHHVAVVYDSEDPAPTNRFSFFLDGEFFAQGSKINSNVTAHGTGSFYLGRGGANSDGPGNGWFNGELDEWFALKGCNTNDVARMYNHRRAALQGVPEATGVLPAMTELTVAAGAKLLVTNANESVAKLTGAGTVEIGAGSELHVKKLRGFTGSIVGGGRLISETTGIAILFK